MISGVGYGRESAGLKIVRAREEYDTGYGSGNRLLRDTVAASHLGMILVDQGRMTELTAGGRVGSPRAECEAIDHRRHPGLRSCPEAHTN